MSRTADFPSNAAAQAPRGAANAGGYDVLAESLRALHVG